VHAEQSPRYARPEMSDMTFVFVDGD